MKHNIIFAVLTALILAFGFYAMKLADFFTSGRNEENSIQKIKIENHAVYLSDKSVDFSPMNILGNLAVPPDNSENIRKISSAMIKAVSEYSDISAILWGIYSDLDSSWQFSDNGYIFADGWEYINSEKKRKKLDCIIDTDDYTILYLRFYGDTAQQITANDINLGLERLGAETDNFYPDIEKWHDMICDQTNQTNYIEKQYYSSHHSNFNIPTISEVLDIKNFSQEEIDFISIWCYLQYFAVKTAADEANIPQIGKFLFSSMFFSNFTVDDGSGSIKTLSGFSMIQDFLMYDTKNLKPEYSTINGIIYQSFSTTKGNLTMIYNINNKQIEGFFFDRK